MGALTPQPSPMHWGAIANEIDVDSHFQPEAIEYDQKRQLFLEVKGIYILRVTNEQVYQQVDEVVEAMVYDRP